MMIKNLILYSLLMFFITSCENSEKENEERDDTEVAEQAEETMEERRSKGDTLSLSPDKLIKALPESIESYTKVGKADKREEKNPGSNWSSVSQNYSNGSSSIQITISDYNGAYGLYAGATAIFNSGAVVQSEDELSRPFSEGKIKGWESFSKEMGEAILIYGRKDRFLISIEGQDQKGLDIVKKFYSSIDINKIID